MADQHEDVSGSDSELEYESDEEAPIMYASWALAVKPGKLYTQELPNNLHISQVALGMETEGDSRVGLFLIQEDEKHVVCSLRERKCEQVPLNLFFPAGETISFGSTAKTATVHILGYVSFDPTQEFDTDDEDEDEDEEDRAELDEQSLKRKLKDTVDAYNDSQSAKKARKEEPKKETTPAQPMTPKQEVKKEAAKTPKQEIKKEAAKTPKQEVAKREAAKTPKQEANKEAKQEAVKTPKQENKKEAAKTPKNEVVKKEGAKTPKSDTPKKVLKDPKQLQGKLANGLQYQIKQVGQGPAVKAGKKVAVKYIGRLEKNGRVFDKSNNFSFRLGVGEVIKAWDAGVSGMQVGETRTLIAPPHLAYGKRGAGPDIPPNSTLVFDVTLLNIQ